MTGRKESLSEEKIIKRTHLEPLTKDKCDEVVDILASIICDYLEKDRKNERAKNN